MMERLMEDGFRYGEPVYTQCSEEMMVLSEVFVKREGASVEGAFREGVLVAILLALDLFPPSRPPQN